jgi:hypothetical protein
MNLPQHPARLPIGPRSKEMNMHASRWLRLTCLASLLALTSPSFAQALGPAFTYQGELRTLSGVANGNYDLEFRLYAQPLGGAQLGATVSANGIAVNDGLFSVPLDFGPAQFAGERQWLEIRVRAAGGGSYETLTPRTELTAAPYAWSAAVALANSVTGVSIVDGSVSSADINPAQVQRRVTGTCPAGQFLRAINQDGSGVCAADANSGGSVTSIATGTGLTGGPITASGTLAIANGGVGAAQIDSSQVQRRVTGVCPPGQGLSTIFADGSVACQTTGGSAGWSLDGNTGTSSQTQFIGTTDAEPLVLRTRNAQSLRIEPSTLLFGSPALPISSNIIAGSHANMVFGGVRGATISGGGAPGGSDPDVNGENNNVVSDHYGAIGGGAYNTAGDEAGTAKDRPFATVGGGNENRASGGHSTVSGGFDNRASASFSTIGAAARILPRVVSVRLEGVQTTQQAATTVWWRWRLQRRNGCGQYDFRWQTAMKAVKEVWLLVAL